MDLTGKRAIVTGAGQGIGKQIALKLAQRGADLIIDDINPQTAPQTAQEVQALGRKAIAIVADVSKKEEVDELVKTAVRELGGMDILVNNAGIARSSVLLRLKDKEWDEVLDVNLKGIFYCTKAVAPSMIKQRYGKIINISSIYGRTGAIGDANYAASKAGIVGFTKSVAKELARYTINVNAVMPGLVDTPLLRGIPEKYLQPMIEEIPLGRVGKPEDIANVVAFLASDDASYMTGAILEVTGGWNM
ncbi:MAG: 3-oxoacyl-ACP reductase FabG [Deltaproteobacteria bacterium]|nr:MAG: 3-oxoacyl-ACP reductase FabG [Deltaproteobacteria bacterium]